MPYSASRTARDASPTHNSWAPLPAPEGPAAHGLKAIRHLAELAGNFAAGSTNHRGIAYEALATHDAIAELHYLAVYVDTDEDTVSIGAEADRPTRPRN